MKTTDDITENYHKGNPRSIEAHESIRATKHKQAERILRFVRYCGEDGATCDETELVLGISHQACSARFTELKAAKKIVASGKRHTRSGRNADVFIVVEDKLDEGAPII